MYIAGLYEKKDIYQVCDEDDNVLFQGGKNDCIVWKYLKEKEYESIKNKTI